MEHALQTLRVEQGEVYAPALTQLAEAAKDSTMKRWRSENKRWFPIREYEEVDSLAAKAESLAHSAVMRARFVKDSLRATTEIGVALLRDRVTDMKSNIEHLPRLQPLRRLIADADGRLLAAESRQSDGDLLGAAGALREAIKLLDNAGFTMDRLVGDYLRAVPEWQNWQKEVIEWSRSNRAVSLVIDKMAHRCLVYRNGEEIASFDVELGPQWIGPKRYEGDLSTPEGRYHITRKRDRGETIYYLALEIDYPNDDDKRWFAAAKENGILPRSARLGGNIELHGNGGKSFDWTRGCIALNDDDMKSVFDLVREGTPVTIVGALAHPFEPLETASTGSGQTAEETEPYSSLSQ